MFLLKHSSKLIVILSLLGIIFVLWLIYDLLEAIFTKFGAIILSIGLIFALIRFVTVISVFPGSYKVTQRKTMAEFNSDFCQKLNQNVEKLIKFLLIDFENSKININTFKFTYT